MSLREVLVGQRQGVYRWDDGLAPKLVEAKVTGAGWRFVHLVTEDAEDKTAFLERCAEAFDLPSWFGHNWDALDECLRALDFDEPDGLLVLWEGWGPFADGDPDAFELAVEVFQDACVAWHDDEVPGAVLLRGDGPETDLPEL